MSNFQQICNLVTENNGFDRKNSLMKDNAFEDAKVIIDDFFKENQFDYNEETKYSYFHS